jgi:hypothetical protein
MMSSSVYTFYPRNERVASLGGFDRSEKCMLFYDLKYTETYVGRLPSKRVAEATEVEGGLNERT